MRKYFVKFFKKKAPYHIDLEYDQILKIHSAYYSALNPELKIRFRSRIYQLLNILSFEGSMEIPIVNREIRTVIACAIAEITFGLNNYLPTRFTHILVLPRRYMYPGCGEPFLGHIDYSRNAVYFSWADVKEGYLISDDAVNVALHEMAHVLEAENITNSLFSEFFSRISWEEWAEEAFKQMHIIRSGQNHFLKNYGGINMKEMFAVCIEAFFEQSEAFKANLPYIYDTLVVLLKQDPTFKSNPLRIK